MNKVVPYLALSIFLREFIVEVAFENFKKHELVRLPCSWCGKHCKAYVTRAGQDAYGLKIDNHDANGALVECSICKKSLSAARFTPHLEKCMGMGRSARSKRTRRNLDSSTKNNPLPSSASEIEEQYGTALDAEGNPSILPDDPYANKRTLMALSGSLLIFRIQKEEDQHPQ